jgi:cytochrome c oxidase subunit 2
VAALIVYFAVKYRRRANVERLQTFTHGRGHGQVWILETTWIVVPFFLALGVFTWGAQIYVDLYRMPAEGMDVSVEGRQGMWKFHHATAQTEINTLHVPVDRTVRLTMISQDVIHSFFVPDFRIKRDVLPGYYTTVWFQATKTGTYHLFCTEYCGAEHANMIGSIVVMEPNQYQQWLSRMPVGNNTGPIPEEMVGGGEARQPQTMAEAGANLFQSLGCSSCHLPDGSGVGPSLVGLFGRPVELQSGETVVADVQYIRDSITHPNAQVVAGYQPIMPSFADQVAEEELTSLIEYIRSLGGEENQ